MRRPAVAALAAAVGVACSTLAIAQSITQAEYQLARKNIESDYRGARGGCEPMRDNVRDICLADVAGREAVSLAELEFVFHPGAGTRNDVLLARAQATYALAREKCDDKAGNARDVCAKEAEAALVAARADLQGAGDAKKRADLQGAADAKKPYGK